MIPSAAIRAFADFVDKYPKLFHDCNNMTLSSPEPEEITLSVFHLYGKEGLARALKALGSCHKVDSGTGFCLRKKEGAITLEVWFLKSTVCERIFIGTKRVPEIPAVPEHEEPVYEWRCSPLLEKVVED